MPEAEHLICPQCLSRNCVDPCYEATCPGRKGFVPREWQRPLHDITQDLRRYEALILDADTHFANPKLASNIALRVSREAQAIRAKQKKEGGAVTPVKEPAPAEPAELKLEN